MSVAMSQERNDVANIESSFVAGKDAILLASARAGESAVFETLVMPHCDALLRDTWRILRNREPEDAVQAAFLDAFRKR